MLLLTTTGARTTPLAYVAKGRNYVISASACSA